VTLTLQSLHEFSGTVSLSASSFPSGISLIFPGNSPTYSVTLSSDASMQIVLTVSISPAPPGQYLATVTATSGSTTTFVTIPVTVIAQPYGGGGGSVATGSQIALSNWRTESVQNMGIGSRVIVYDVVTGYQTTATVTQILTVLSDSLLTLHTSAGLPFRADANPKMKLHVLVDGRPVLEPITMIRSSDQIFNWDLQSWVTVISISLSYQGHHTMYDLVTDPLYTPSGAVLEYIANGYPDCPQACKN
jgi:hypothetical protein